MEFLGRHVFLAVNLIGLLGVALAIAASGRHRGGVIAAGAIQTLHAPLTPLFDGIYWSPPRLGALPVGIEDILLCFCLGAGVWFSATRPWRNRIAHGAGLRQVLLRINAIAARENLSPRHVHMTISLAFLSPRLIKAAIDGRLPHGVSVSRLFDPPASWRRQHDMLGLAF